MRRLLVLLLPALALSACGGTPSGDAAQKVAFLKDPAIRKLKDQELARLCPSLYPTDYLYKSRAKHYRYTRDKTRFVPTAEQRAKATGAGCTAQGTKPK